MLFAGRHLPRGEEAILLGFTNIKPIPDPALPQGQGFEVSNLVGDPTGGGRTCLALTRREVGSLELFALMADDVIRLLERSASETAEIVLQRFLSRIRAWQDFMERKREGALSPEEEVGLFGELVVLDQLLDAGVAARTALEVWQGPLDGLQDFMFGSGAIEVKTTLSAVGFTASVGSLEQLDETLCHPLFVAGVRLLVDASGRTLPALADAMRDKLSDERVALEAFEIRMIRGGLLATSADRYVRRFSHACTALYVVEGGFPRLTRDTVNPAIRKVRYELDLSLAEHGDLDLVAALRRLGAL
jgi:hypothetical protein